MIGLLVRFVVSALVILFTGFIVPGFEVLGFVNAFIAAIAIAVIGYVVESLMGNDVTPQNRGIIGFITAAIIIWVAQFVVPGMQVTIIGALLAALVIGLIDAVVPTALRR